jgi:RNA polymerase sigma factor (TIGR02999 family)
LVNSITHGPSLHPQNEAEITQWLNNWREGNADALSRLTEAVYHELHRLACAAFRTESGPRTIQPTALIHELYLQLPGLQTVPWQSRSQFLNVAAKMMRNILVDHARKRRALKRGGGQTSSDIGISIPPLDADVLTVHEALERFAKDYPRHAHIVELRFFGGLTVEETVQVLTATGSPCALRTVERDWNFARAWLQNAIRDS